MLQKRQMKPNSNLLWETTNTATCTRHPHGETRWWQVNDVVMLFFSRDKELVRADRKMNGAGHCGTLEEHRAEAAK